MKKRQKSHVMGHYHARKANVGGGVDDGGPESDNATIRGEI